MTSVVLHCHLQASEGNTENLVVWWKILRQFFNFLSSTLRQYNLTCTENNNKSRKKDWEIHIPYSKQLQIKFSTNCLRPILSFP